MKDVVLAQPGGAQSLLHVAWPRLRAAIALSLLALAYAVLRLKLNRESEFASWEQMLSFTAPLPFGHRVLTPALAKTFMLVTGRGPKAAFAVLEFGSTLLMLGGLWGVLRMGMPSRPATLFTLGFVLLLPFLFLLQTPWPLYYPYDTLSMALCVLVQWALLSRKTAWALGLMFLAALNRESALFLVGIYLAMRVGRDSPRSVLLTAAGLLSAFYSARGLIGLLLPDNPGAALHWMHDHRPRVVGNLGWLMGPSNAAMVLAYVGFLPLGYWLLGDRIPALFRRVHLVLLAMFLSLLLVGNIYEPRIFGELLVLGYVPLAAAACAWLFDEGTTYAPVRDEWLVRPLQLADRFGPVLLVGGWAGLVWLLHLGLVRFW